MKFSAKQITFLVPSRWTFAERMLIWGKENTLHVQETALVVEGNRQRLTLPVVEVFLRRVLSDWTMLTIPYSRVLTHRYDRYPVRKILLWLAWLGLSTYWFFSMELAQAGALRFLPGALLSLLAALLILMIHSRLLQSCHHIVFRQASGKRAVLCFRFRSRKQHGKFEQQFRSNWQLARTVGSGLRNTKEREEG